MILKLTNGSATNPQTVDLSPYVDVNDGQGFDIADPAMTQKVWGHSLLRAGATEALETNFQREITIPLKIGPIGGAGGLTTLSQVVQFIELINQIGRTPGATLEWQPDHASQPTYFEVISSQVDAAYRYRAEQQSWEMMTARIFTQPFGRTAAPRPYAAASAVGPLLMISPWASGGALAVAPSSVGYGGSPGAFNPNGASGGVSYFGAPSLAGDAPAQLQISYVGPLPASSVGQGCVPWTLVSLLPDALYRPLITAPEIVQLSHGTGLQPGGGASERTITQSTAVASSYHSLTTLGFPYAVSWAFNPVPSADLTQEPRTPWTGQHRVLAIARASAAGSQIPASLSAAPGGLMPAGASVFVPSNIDWGVYDLGAFSLRASEAPSLPVVINGAVAASQSLDVNAFIMVPDNATWFLPPTALAQQASQYGVPSSWFVGDGALAFGVAPYTNTLLLDDVIGDQFIYQGASRTFAPSPIGSIPSPARVTQFTRGLVPEPDPKDGLPIIAILSIAQSVASPVNIVNHLGGGEVITGASWPNPQNLRTFAQVNVLERARFILP